MTSAASCPVPPIILLVEDELDTSEMYERYLSGAGYWVASAHSELEACTTFDEIQPDIVVADLGLPQRTAGLHVIDHVRERAADVPVGGAPYEYFEPCPHGCGRFFRQAADTRLYRLP